MELQVNGRQCRVLIDTGCTDNIVYSPVCTQWRPERVTVTTISGDPFTCSGKGTVAVQTPSGQHADVEVLVVSERPMGADMIIGMAGIAALGGITVIRPTEVRFCGTACGPAPQVSAADLSTKSATADGPALQVDAPDFSAKFDPQERVWTVAWKWADGAGPDQLKNCVAQYKVPEEDRQQFDEELTTWIDNQWLIPYDSEKFGPPRGLIPLMAVPQPNKGKIRPVLDYRELNTHLDSHTADAQVCADQLRKWRRHGRKVAVVDLKKAYLQLHVEEQFWPFQTVMVHGKLYALTRLGFGNSSAPQILTAVIRAVLDQDPRVAEAVLPYADDLLVNEDVLSAPEVVEHFKRFGLACKAPERVGDDDVCSSARFTGGRVGRRGIAMATRQPSGTTS